MWVGGKERGRMREGCVWRGRGTRKPCAQLWKPLPPRTGLALR